MKIKRLAAIVTVAVLMIASLTGCDFLNGQDDKIGSQSSIVSQSSEKQDTKVSENENSSSKAENSSSSSNTEPQKEQWKIDFEKKLYENYQVKPDRYEDLGNGIYTVYVTVDGKSVPYVTVDSATGEYHG